MAPINAIYFFSYLYQQPYKTMMKSVFAILILFSSFFSLGQDLLFKIDHDQTYKKLKWEEIQERKVTFKNNYSR